MITTRDYRETIIARKSESAEGLSILRDLVNADIRFKELARQTMLGEKPLHRMLHHSGNPTARNLGIKPRVEFA